MITYLGFGTCQLWLIWALVWDEVEFTECVRGLTIQKEATTQVMMYRAYHYFEVHVHRVIDKMPFIIIDATVLHMNYLKLSFIEVQ